MSGSVLIMAGGTGGHIFPALTLAGELRARGYEVNWLGAERGMETRLVPPHGLPMHLLRVEALRGGGPLQALRGGLQLLRALWQARAILRRTRARLAVGFGGYASGPGGIAATLAGVPLLLHEQNAIPGLTNRVLARVATRVLQAFDGAFGARAETVGNPVRPAIAALPDPARRYGERQGPLRVLVTGGSQGAQVLNVRLPAALRAVAGELPLMVRHQAGAGQVAVAADAWRNAGVAAEVCEFIDDMADAYGWADLVVCRAGALTVAEIAAAGVAALLVPLPTAVDDHQTANARWLTERGAALLLPQARLDVDGLAAVLGDRLERTALAEIARRARALAAPDSARRMADICEEMLREPTRP